MFWLSFKGFKLCCCVEWFLGTQLAGRSLMPQDHGRLPFISTLPLPPHLAWHQLLTQPTWEFLSHPRLQMSIRLKNSGFLEWNIYWTIFYLARLLFLGFLAQESRSFLAWLLLCRPVGIFRFPASSAPILRYIKQKSNARNSTLCHSLALNSCYGFFTSSSRVYFVFVFVCTQRFLGVLSERNREKCIYTIFPKALILNVS